jgi:hypothetical protein
LLVLIGMLGDAIATRLGRFNPHPVVSVQPREFIELEIESAAGETKVYSKMRN